MLGGRQLGKIKRSRSLVDFEASTEMRYERRKRDCPKGSLLAIKHRFITLFAIVFLSRFPVHFWTLIAKGEHFTMGQF